MCFPRAPPPKTARLSRSRSTETSPRKTNYDPDEPQIAATTQPNETKSSLPLSLSLSLSLSLTLSLFLNPACCCSREFRNLSVASRQLRVTDRPTCLHATGRFYAVSLMRSLLPNGWNMLPVLSRPLLSPGKSSALAGFRSRSQASSRFDDRSRVTTGNVCLPR